MSSHNGLDKSQVPDLQGVALSELIAFEERPDGGLAIVAAPSARCDCCNRPFSDHHPVFQWCPA